MSRLLVPASHVPEFVAGSALLPSSSLGATSSVGRGCPAVAIIFVRSSRIVFRLQLPQRLGPCFLRLSGYMLVLDRYLYQPSLPTIAMREQAICFHLARGRAALLRPPWNEMVSVQIFIPAQPALVLETCAKPHRSHKEISHKATTQAPNMNRQTA